MPLRQRTVSTNTSALARTTVTSSDTSTMRVTPISVPSEKSRFNSFFSMYHSRRLGDLLLFFFAGGGWVGGLLANGVHNGLNWGVTLLYSCIIVFFFVV